MKFEEVYIHIGLHKTASTYLQRKVFCNEEDLLYVTRPYTQCNVAFNKLLYADDSLYSHDEFMAEIALLPTKKKLLLSDEAFSGIPTLLGDINRSITMKRLKKAFPHAVVLLFLRGQNDLFKSHYNQYVKGDSGTLDLPKFVWKPRGKFSYEDYIDNSVIDEYTPYYKPYYGNIHVDCFKFFEMVDTYKNTFDQVEVFLYEDFKNNPNRVIARINNIMGTDWNGDSIQRQNQSISDFRLAVKRRFNILNAGFKNAFLESVSRRLIKILPEFKRYKSRKDNIIDEIVGDYYKSNNAKLIDKYPDIGIQRFDDFYQV